MKENNIIEDEWTTIRVLKSVVSMLEALKVHPNQSNNEVIHNMILERKDNKED